MRITGRIVEVHSGSNFTDGLQRVTIRLNEADSLYRDVRLPNTEGWDLDEEVVFELVAVASVVVQHMNREAGRG